MRPLSTSTPSTATTPTPRPSTRQAVPHAKPLRGPTPSTRQALPHTELFHTPNPSTRQAVPHTELFHTPSPSTRQALPHTNPPAACPARPPHASSRLPAWPAGNLSPGRPPALTWGHGPKGAAGCRVSSRLAGDTGRRGSARRSTLCRCRADRPPHARPAAARPRLGRRGRRHDRRAVIDRPPSMHASTKTAPSTSFASHASSRRAPRRPPPKPTRSPRSCSRRCSPTSWRPRPKPRPISVARARSMSIPASETWLP